LLRIVTVYPDLLGTYGDRGNGIVLQRRAQLRAIDVELVEARSDVPLPRADLYCIGGGEDGPQQLAVERLGTDGTLQVAIREGAVVLAVCAGLQVLGRSFPVGPSARADGLGILPVDTVSSLEPRAVGEVVVDTRELGSLTGFENHAGRTVLDVGATALGVVRRGVGNGDGTDGVLAGRLVGTYLHGPVLARNPTFADHVLALSLGREGLEPLDSGAPESLHDERLAAGRRATR
jgi:CobQ-like glutamine amidotransferase family enzyme